MRNYPFFHHFPYSKKKLNYMSISLGTEDWKGKSNLKVGKDFFFCEEKQQNAFGCYVKIRLHLYFIRFYNWIIQNMLDPLLIIHFPDEN